MLYRADDANAFDQKFIEIILENKTGVEISKATFRCGRLTKTVEHPEFPLSIELSADETALLDKTNICYLAVFDNLGRKRTCEGSFTFETKGQVV